MVINGFTGEVQNSGDEATDNFPDDLKEQLKPKLCLKYWCLKFIRGDLMTMDPNRNLPYACLKLGLPKALISYILYNVPRDDEIY